MIGEFIELSNGIEIRHNISINNVPGFDTRKSLASYKATIIARNKEVCKLEGKIEKSNYEITVDFLNCKYIIKGFGQSNTIETIKKTVDTLSNIAEKSFGQAMQDLLLPQIYDQNGKLIGKCEMLTDRDGVQSYLYYKYTINDTVLYVYELSQGEDILYCAYNSNNQMIAMISKEKKVVHGHARYTIYSCNDEWFEYAVLITSCIELKNTHKDGSAGTYKKSNLITTNPNLLQKYNPTFIEQVKQKEGINNLPENMQLVKEKINESKNGKDIKLFKYTVLIFVLIFVFLLIYIVMKFGVRS